MDLINLDFVKLSPNIKTPTKATQFSVGLDIYSPKDYILTPQNQLIIPGLRTKDQSSQWSLWTPLFKIWSGHETQHPCWGRYN